MILNNCRITFRQINIISIKDFKNLVANYKNCENNSSVRVMLMYDNSLRKIMQSYFKLCEDKMNHFACCILARSIIEQFTKSWFIYLTIRLDYNKYAEIWLNDYANYEMKGYFDKVLPYISEEMKLKIEQEYLDAIKDQNPSQANKIFKWQELIAKLRTDFIESHKMLDQLLLNYSQLCSFVHGGVDAIQGSYGDIDRSKHLLTMEYLTELCLGLFAQNRICLFLAFGINNDVNVRDIIIKIDDLIKNLKN